MGKTVVLFGSPRKNGNTSNIVNGILEKIKGEVIFIDAYEKNVAPCTDCKHCYEKGKCCIKDDMEEIYLHLEHCEKIIIATPMYFCSIPSPLKAIVDRLQVYWSRKFILKNNSNHIKEKEAVLIITAGSNTEKFYLVEEMMKDVFSLLKVKSCGNIFISNLDKKTLSKQEVDNLIKKLF